MREDLPASIENTAHDLSPEALVHLFKIELQSGTTFLLSQHGEQVWRGETYEDVPCNLVGIGQHSDAEVNRPRFSFANPEGLFTAALYNGDMDNAWVTRIRILKSDLDADNDFSVQETFQMRRIVNISKSLAVVELRDVLDGQNFDLPARRYMPPEFPHVKLR